MERRQLCQLTTSSTNAFERYRNDPVGFCREVLGVEPWERQQAIMRSVAANARTTVRACHYSGKTYAAACLAQWWIRCFSPSLVITTAPTDRQVKEVLWKEIRSLHAGAGMAGVLNRQDLTVSPNQRAFGFTTSEPEKFQGWHCLSEEHEILTRRGWLGIDAVNESDEVLSVPVNGDTAEWMPVTAVHRYPFNGALNVYESQAVSFAVTDEHRFPAKFAGWIKDWKLRPFSDMASQFMVRQVADWQGKEFAVPAPFAAYEWSPAQFAEFLGFWIGDGGLRMHSKTGRFYEVLLYQIRPDGGYSRGLLPNVRVQTGRDHVVFCNRACAEWLADHVGRYGAERRIPRFILDAPPAVLGAFIEGFWRAEGTLARGRKIEAFNANAALMGQVQEILIKLGRPATLATNRRAGSMKRTAGRDFLMRRDCLRIGWHERPADHIVRRHKVERRHYEGRVWCISTPHQTFYTRRNGRVFLSGNSQNILVIVDEASGVDEAIYEAIEGVLTGPNARLLLIGNPNNPQGSFYESFRSELYANGRFHISAFDVPDSLLPPTWAEERRQEWGESSPMYQVRVLGEFPPQSEDALISLKWAEDAQERESSDDEGASCEIGVDVARYGSDETVACARRGRLVVAIEAWRGSDTMATAGRLTALARRLGGARIKVDDIGVGGGVTDRLLEDKVAAQGINVGEKARDDEKFANRRAELYWGLRERFKSGDISIPKDDILLSQLTALRYSYTPRGQIKVESKDDLRKRRPQGAKWTSPDRADALALAFAAAGNRWVPVSIYGNVRDQ